MTASADQEAIASLGRDPVINTATVSAVNANEITLDNNTDTAIATAELLVLNAGQAKNNATAVPASLAQTDNQSLVNTGAHILRFLLIAAGLVLAGAGIQRAASQYRLNR